MGDVRVSDELKRNYENYYDEHDSGWRRLGALGKADNVVALCGDLPHDSVIEIGAGDGSILQRLSELRFGEALFGLEISQSGVDAIRARAIARLIECRLFDGYTIPYDDQRFDLAVISHVIEHVEHPRQLIYEAMRVARRIYIEVPLEDTLRMPADYVPHRVGHINFYSPKTLRRLAQTCGLRVIAQRTTNPSKGHYTFRKGRRGLPGYWMKETCLRLLPGVAPRLFTYHGSIVCEPIEPPQT